MLELITDRTASDVANGTVKGTYSDVDMNRVQSAISTLRSALSENGYNLADLFPMPEWKEKSIPSVQQFQEYLENVRIVRSALAVLPSTPKAPQSMSKMDFKAANNIEKILVDVETLLETLKQVYIHADMPWAYAGVGFYAVSPKSIWQALFDVNGVAMQDSNGLILYARK